MKKTSHNITYREPARHRRLQLSKEAIRTLRAVDLSAANGGAGCDSTSFTTERRTLDTATCKC
jgi:hypothetical protein